MNSFSGEELRALEAVTSFLRASSFLFSSRSGCISAPILRYSANSCARSAKEPSMNTCCVEGAISWRRAETQSSLNSIPSRCWLFFDILTNSCAGVDARFCNGLSVMVGLFKKYTAIQSPGIQDLESRIEYPFEVS